MKVEVTDIEGLPTPVCPMCERPISGGELALIAEGPFHLAIHEAPQETCGAVLGISQGGH